MLNRSLIAMPYTFGSSTRSFDTHPGLCRWGNVSCPLRSTLIPVAEIIEAIQLRVVIDQLAFVVPVVDWLAAPRTVTTSSGQRRSVTTIASAVR